jgi:hypothetical protein
MENKNVNETNVDEKKNVAPEVALLEKKLRVNTKNDLIGFIPLYGVRVCGRVKHQIKDAEGHVTGCYTEIKICRDDCMDDLTFTGSEYLYDVLVPFAQYDMAFDIEEKRTSLKCVGSSGAVYSRDVSSSKFKLTSFCNHK